MKMLKILACFSVFALFTSCITHEPEKHSLTSAEIYNIVDVPFDAAWSKAFEILSQKGQITSNDTVNNELGVQIHSNTVTVRITPLTAETCRFHVSARNKFLYPDKAAAMVVYNELNRALTKLEK